MFTIALLLMTIGLVLFGFAHYFYEAEYDADFNKKNKVISNVCLILSMTFIISAAILGIIL